MLEGLPPSTIDPDDYPRGPNGMALLIEDRIAELEGRKAECRSKQERRPINQHLHTLRGMLSWCKSRAGYESTLKDLCL